MGITTVLQIEYYDNGEPNPYYHRPQDTIAHLNLNYWYEQIKAAIVIAAKLAEPVLKIQ